MGHYIIKYAIPSTIAMECCKKSILATLAGIKGTQAHKPLVYLPVEDVGSSVRESSWQ